MKRPYKVIGEGVTLVRVDGELLFAVNCYLKKIKSGRAPANKTNVWIYRIGAGHSCYAFVQRVQRDTELEQVLNLKLIHGPYMIGGERA